MANFKKFRDLCNFGILNDVKFFVFTSMSLNLFCIFLFGILNKFNLIFAFFNIIIIYYFRNVARLLIKNPNNFLSICDGLVLSVSEEYSIPEYLKPHNNNAFTKISILINADNLKKIYYPINLNFVDKISQIGQFFSHSFDENKDSNTQDFFIFKHENKNIIVHFISCILKKNILHNQSINQTIEQGDEMCTVLMPTVVNIYLPKGNFEILVRDGHHLIAREVVLAKKII